MDVTLYGRLADFGGRTLSADLPPDGCTVADLRRLLAEADPALGTELARPGVRAVTGDAFLADDHRLAAGDRVEFWPPVSGG